MTTQLTSPGLASSPILYLVTQDAPLDLDDPAGAPGAFLMVVYAHDRAEAVVKYEQAAASVINFDRSRHAEPQATPLYVGALYSV